MDGRKFVATSESLEPIKLPLEITIIKYVTFYNRWIQTGNLFDDEGVLSCAIVSASSRVILNMYLGYFSF